MCQSYRPETDRRQTALQRVAVAARAVNLPRHGAAPARARLAQQNGEMTMKTTTGLLTAALLATTAIGASAETLRWARAGDSLTLDPHAQNEGPTHTLDAPDLRTADHPRHVRGVSAGAGDRLGAQAGRPERLGVQPAPGRDLP
jgi:hypothetical protein